MLINNNLIYFELQKTGSTYTKHILKRIPNSHNRIVGKHNTYDSVASKTLGYFAGKTKMGNIRNPWDWYVSLWAFGCMRKSGLYERVTYIPDFLSWKGLKIIFRKRLHGESIFPNTDLWSRVYSDPENVANFREWLNIILVDENMSFGERYKESAISSVIGLLTFRYMKLYTYNGKREISKLLTLDCVRKHDRENNFMDVMIRNESIHVDLLSNINILGCDESTLRDILFDCREK